MCHEEMINILTHLQKYVQCKSYVKTLNLEPYTQTKYELATTLLVDDQLTWQTMYKSQRKLREQFGQYCGLLPVIEDWHAKVCFVEVGV